MASSNSGGAAAVRGFLVQAVVALLDTVRADPPFFQIILEPTTGNDQFDYLWTAADGSHATQVKSTINTFARTDVERWASELQTARNNESCRLVLVGNMPPALDGIDRIAGVVIERKGMNLQDLIDQAANGIARFLEARHKPSGTADERDRAVHAVIARLQHLSAKSQSFSYAEFVDLLCRWIGTLQTIPTATHRLMEELRAALPTPLKRYQNALVAAYSAYDELGTPIGGETHSSNPRAITIPDIFVAPGCAIASIPLEEFDAALLRGEQPSQDVLRQLDLCFSGPAPRRLVLLGDPGMGKSTLIKWLVVMPLLDDLEHRRALPPSLRGCIPLPFIVRDLVRHLPATAAAWDWESLKLAFRAFHATRHAREPLLHAYAQDDAAFDALLQDPAALFLVDGLDEIGDPHKRQAMRDALWQGFNACPAARWLLTSRRVGYDQVAVHREERVAPHVGDRHTSQSKSPPAISSPDQDSQEVLLGTQHAWLRESAAVSASIADIVCEQVEVTDHARLLTLTPFDNNRQDDYARRWFSARLADDHAAQSTAHELMREVRSRPHTRAISRVPNLLCLMALLKLRHIPLPEGRTRLYEAITLADHPNLTELGLQDCHGISSLEPLGSLASLDTLNLQNSAGWEDLRPLGRLTGLFSLNLSHCAFVHDITPLAGLRELRTLNLNQTAVTDLRPLAGHPNLTVLELNETTVTDLSPLRGITTLRNLSLIRCGVLNAAQVAKLQADLPDCMIFGDQDN